MHVYIYKVSNSYFSPISISELVAGRLAIAAGQFRWLYNVCTAGLTSDLNAG